MKEKVLILQEVRMLKRIGKFIVLAGFVFLAGGCYEVNQEIITATDAQKVYNIVGTYTGDNPDQSTSIWEVPGTNDYRFEEKGKSSTSGGYLRAIHLRDNIYLVQAKYDDGYIYVLFFEFVVTSSRVRYDPVVPTSDVSGLASQYNVKINFDEFGDYLEGDRRDILGFLLAHKNLEFSRVEPP